MGRESRIARILFYSLQAITFLIARSQVREDLSPLCYKWTKAIVLHEAGIAVKRPYYLKKRGDFWYYRLNPESGLVTGENLNYYTTGCRTREAAEAFMADMLGQQREIPTFCSYTESFFIWGKCPHIRRVLEETGRFTQRRARIQRGRLKKYIFSDPFANKRLSQITRADIFDLRSRLLRRCSPATTNKVIDVVKVVLREAVIREELDRDPTELVRTGYATRSESAASSPWKSSSGCFQTTGTDPGRMRGTTPVFFWQRSAEPEEASCWCCAGATSISPVSI